MVGSGLGSMRGGRGGLRAELREGLQAGLCEGSMVGSGLGSVRAPRPVRWARAQLRPSRLLPGHPSEARVGGSTARIWAGV